ncbi:DUF805 domain-containing protein [Bacillus luteolus]|uniref:DUF805 domain-containing protein n=1 Tax=Litchfieldia luteola TaxID=682179 RepID=A0ABR9QMC3_9BACI|nr:DUF805 domain-containing protein [Cytobacillus luteolus]MBE4909647.1 DUF805 domain-containing protein [Cytobacillus luteolus]MBP1941048.1 uncharacterized membrane protein YhaH (DUF805 family) [Cytobacillus luteolus]
MSWFLKAIKNYAVFRGRARRTEYWMFVLVSAIFAFVIAFIEPFLGIEPILSGIYSLFLLLPSLSVTVRRLHDTGRSGWWILISLIPLIGAIVLFVFTVLDSEPGENKYGPSPK